MTAMEPPRRRLRLWHWIVGGLIVLLTAFSIGIPIWFRSTADLDAFEVLAKARGIATHWEEVAAERPLDPERAAILDELLEYVRTVRAWEELDKANAIVAGQPLPAGLREYHESLPPDFWPTVTRLLRRLDGRPVVRHRSVTMLTRDSGYLLRLSWLAREAWLMGLIDIDVLLGMPDLLDSPEPHRVRERCGMRQVVLRSLLERPPTVPDDRVQARLEGWVGRVHRDINEQLRYSLIYYCGSMRALPLDGSAEAALVQAGLPDFGTRFLYCWSRGDSLTVFSDMVEAAATGPGMAEQAHALWRQAEQLEQRSQGLGWFRYATADWLMPLVLDAQDRLLRSALASSVVLHELGHGPWPEDPFAPPGSPLRRHERDGILIGAWSVWLNGVDDGGAMGRDLRIELRPPWDAPSSSP